MDNKEITLLKKALERQKKARKQAERILETKSNELYEVTRHLQETNNKLENLLTEKTSELDGVFINIIDPYVVMDMQFNIINMNESAKQFLGFDYKKEVVNLTKFVHKDFIQYTYESVKSLFEVGILKNYRAKAQLNKTTEKWVEINASLIYNKDRKPIAAQGIIRDITDQKYLQQQKTQLLEDLEASNHSLQEYAHIVSHDLKSPLRSISALATWLQEDYASVLDETGMQNLGLMQEKIKTMDNLIKGILEYSTANSSVLDNSTVDLNNVIAEIQEVIFIPKHVRLLVPQKLPAIIADRTKIYQVFQNIISNAVVHITRLEGLVTVLFNEEKDFWKFTVKDNGVGIPSEYQDKIFEIFQSISDNKKSTGIGLSIVKKIVDRYGGTIWLNSEVNVGTEFHFTIKKI